MVVAVAAEPSVGQPPLVVEIAGKICPWTYLPHAVMGEESHLSSSYPWMTYVHPSSFGTVISFSLQVSHPFDASLILIHDGT